MPLELVGSPETVVAGVAVLLTGYLIRYQGWTFLIAGYDESSDVPADVAESIVGNFAMRVGIATIAYGMLVTTVSETQLVSAAFAAIVVGGLLRVLYRLNTYESGVVS